MAVNKLILGTVTLALLGAGPAHAGDAAMPTKAPAAASALDWAGPYLGAHFGPGLGNFDAGTHPAAGEVPNFSGSRLKGWLGGFQAGYNVLFPDRVVLGVEAGLSFTSVGGGRDLWELGGHET